MLWDSLLVAATARELARELRGGRTRALHLDRGAARVALYLRERTVLFGPHPASGGVALAGQASPPAGAMPLAGLVRDVAAPRDERAILVEIARLRGRTRRTRLVLELSPGRWNALLTEGARDRIRSVLRRRPSAGRRLLPGAFYELPRPSKRRGAGRPLSLASWLELLEDLQPEERVPALVRNVAYVSRLNAGAFLGSARGGVRANADGTGQPGPQAGSGETRAALEEGWRRWRQWRLLEETRPQLLSTNRGLQPYPYPLPGVGGGARETLLAAFAESSGMDPRASLVPSEVMSTLERRIGAAEGKLLRLREQMDNLDDPVRLRATGDLLLARMGSIPRGAARVRLEDFEGGTVHVALDPTLAPHENAARHYARAARVERAARALPQQVGDARARLDSWYALSDEVAAGTVGTAELERRLGLAARRAKPGRTPPRLPYHRFRSSLGTEIRVGRGASDNHELTFRHSDPDDIWLHARHGSGAHVVLRWRGEGGPAPSDLEEAAVLAALNSRSRTAATVPVDWTRRKYVRKPRGAAPGMVVIEREKTVFVAPDPKLAERLREDPGADSSATGQRER